uniref:Uncharacterized protein n=1 Tax=Chromera velia CCMP2878 TaxID=1169474 RepID=A0A0G4HV69_9ALVE|eukprot:Cvel_8798.t1-p1 / transcript=Cvel_8798.t1 / gene=Cvel_8798 / organism=Chromera_velia_CCMP2878 / gene_product=hypothetical protein / transcript_product=hypothetical protein / location=Cvel_scaffold493:10528-13365(+) / protein_length=363 / sequence_SO=supercontig / SO=protein_coding / is_pseudo=false
MLSDSAPFISRFRSGSEQLLAPVERWAAAMVSGQSKTDTSEIETSPLVIFVSFKQPKPTSGLIDLEWEEGRLFLSGFVAVEGLNVLSGPRGFEGTVQTHCSRELGYEHFFFAHSSDPGFLNFLEHALFLQGTRQTEETGASGMPSMAPSALADDFSITIGGETLGGVVRRDLSALSGFADDHQVEIPVWDTLLLFWRMFGRDMDSVMARFHGGRPPEVLVIMQVHEFEPPGDDSVVWSSSSLLSSSSSSSSSDPSSQSSDPSSSEESVEQAWEEEANAEEDKENEHGHSNQEGDGGQQPEDREEQDSVLDDDTLFYSVWTFSDTPSSADPLDEEGGDDEENVSPETILKNVQESVGGAEDMQC